MVKRSESEQFWREVSPVVAVQDFYKFKCLSLNEIGKSTPRSCDVLYEYSDADFLNNKFYSLNCTRENAGARNSTAYTCRDSMASYAVVILGELSVGKSALCRNFFQTGLQEKVKDKCATQRDYVEDLFDDGPEESLQKHHIFERPVLVNGTASRIRILDVNTEKQFMESETVDGFGDLSAYLDVGDGYIVAYTVTDIGTFDTACNILQTIEESQSTRSKRSPVILVGNKCDLVRKRQVSTCDGVKVAEKFNVKFIETSASLNQNVDQLFHGIIRQMRLRGVESKQCLHECECQKLSKTRFTDALYSSLNNIRFMKEKKKTSTSIPKSLCENCKFSSTCSSTSGSPCKTSNQNKASKTSGVAEKCLRKIKRKKQVDRKSCQDLSVL